MTKNLRLLFFGICFICCKPFFSQNASSELGNWYMFNGSHKVSEKWSIETMAHFRYYEFSNNFQQEIYRLGINYNFSKKLNATIGYSYVTTDVLFGKPSATIFENRIYEDINYNHFFNKLKLRHRVRFEHRFLRENFANKESHWFRYDLNVKYPINDTWSVYAFNEIFLNLNKNKRFIQNWSGFGVLHKLHSSLSLNIGYQQIKFPSEVQKRILLGIILHTNHLKKVI